MIQGIRNKISYILRATKKRLSFIVIGLILSRLIYIIIFNGGIIEPQKVLSVLGIIYNNSFSDLNSDKVVSILGTLAQSNATILAIVISLSLLVIEFSASKYSARVVDVFKRDPILWEFLIVYGFSIFCPIFLISRVNENTSNSSLKFYFITTYALSIIAYFSLFLYILHVFKMMKPSSVIGALSKKIDIQSLHESWYRLDETYDRYSKEEPRINKIDVDINRDVKSEKDPVLPIIDIIRASIMRYEYDTARYGLEAVKNRLLITLIQNPFEEKRVSGHVFKRILEIWNLALRNKDLEFIKMVLTQYADIGELCTKAPNFLYTTFLSEYYMKQAFKSISEVKEDEFQSLSISLVKCVNEIGLETFRNRYELKSYELRLDDDKIKALESLESSITELSYFLRDIGVFAIKADSKRAVDEAILALDNIGKASVDHNLIHSIFHIVENLNIIGEESAKKGMDFESSTKQVVECLEKLASRINAHSEELTSGTQKQVIEYHEYVKENYDYENTKYAFEELSDGVELIIRAYISSHMYTIGMESIRNNLLDATQQCLKSLETIERILQDDTESRHIGEDIRCLGLEAIKNEQTYPLIKDIINSIYLIGLRQFGYMFDWDRDRDSWDMDKNKYRKFLEKEYRDYSARGLKISNSEFVNNVKFEDSADFSSTVYLDGMIHGEKILIIGDEERKDIKCLYLKDIEDVFFEDDTLKLFEIKVYTNSEKAYYEVPKLLKELTNPILEYTLNSLSNETIKPFTMIIQCFENFGMLSIHFRDDFSLNKIFISTLVTIGNSFDNIKYLKYDKEDKAWEDLYWVTEVISNSIYKLAIESLKYNLADIKVLHRQMKCLIDIERKYHSMFHVEDEFKRIIEMIKESELEESKCNETIKLIEDAIQEFKNEKLASNGKQLDLHQKEEQSST